MPFRFVHAADIHLDSPLKSLALRDPQLGELVGNATRHAFTAIVDLCLDERVDALILSGDLYDGDQTSMKTARFLGDALKKLQDAGIRTFIIRGNHDALSKITRELVLPQGAKLFSGRAEAVEVGCAGGLDVVVQGVSFAEPRAPESLLPRYKPPVEGAVNIGLMHTSLGGAKGHDHYAPCSLADLAGSGFTYWALGHIHGRAVTTGPCTVVMPGMPQGRDVGEAGEKSVTLVTVGDDRSVAVEERRTSIAQFETVPVDVTGSLDWSDVVGRIAAGLQATRLAVGSPHLVARISIRGSTTLAWRIRRDVDLLLAEAQQRADALGHTWIDKLEAGVAAPAHAGKPGGGALAELHRLISEEVRGSPSFIGAMAELVAELGAQLPPECRHVLGADEAAVRETVSRLAREGGEVVLARLEARAGGEA